jgi:competence protein ComEC
VRVVASVPAIGLIAGSAVGLLFHGPPAWLGLPLLILLAFAAIWAERRASVPVIVSLVCTGFFTGGAMLSADAWHEAWRPTLRLAFEELARQERSLSPAPIGRAEDEDGAFAIVSGVLKADATQGAAGVMLAVDVDSIETRTGTAEVVSGGVQATVVGALAANAADNWHAGRRVRMPIQLRRPSRYLDPGVPDFEQALARRGTTLVGTVKSGALVEVVARGNFIDESAARVRAVCRRSIQAAVGQWDERSAAIVAAIVIGDRAGLDEELQRRLQEAGTYHVIAISGGNIAVLAGLLLAAFRVVGMLGRVAMLAAIGVLVAYDRIVGGGASVDRATCMAVVYFAARALDQRSPPLNVLALATACLVAARPLSVVDPAFALTVGATLSILLTVPLVQSLRLPPSFGWLLGLLVSSVATEIALLPIGALFFSRVTFAGLGLNFAAIPLMAVAQLAGMALVPVALVSTAVASAIGCVAHLAASGLMRTADLAQLVPVLTFRVAPPSAWSLTLYYLAVISGCLCRRRTRWRRTVGMTAVLAAVWIVAEPWAFVERRGDGRLHATFLDVGQGDSVFLRFPHGTTLLVDAGGLPARSTFDIGDRVVAPVLRMAGTARLDFIALTHGDPDHIGGAPAILREFRAKEVWEGIPVPPFEPLQLLREQARSIGSNWSNLRAGDRFQIDGVDVLVIHPGLPDWERQRVRNDDSLVLDLRWGDVSLLLTGDIGRSVERERLSNIAPAPMRIVKVPHHGSLTSSSIEFVRALAPTVAVVSAGRGNHFGHPVPEVLQRYDEVGAQIFRTDRDGAVTVDTDGRSIEVFTYSGRRRSFPAAAVHQKNTVNHEATKDTKTNGP